MSIIVVVRQPGEQASAREVEPTLVELRSVIGGGYLECIQTVHGVFEGAVLNLFVDEDARQKKLAPNIECLDGQPPLLGTVLAVKTNPDGKDVGLVGDEVERVIQLINSYKSAQPSDN